MPPKLPANATLVEQSGPRTPVLPSNAKVVVKEHTRGPRYNPARMAIEAGALGAARIPVAATDAIIDQLPAIAGTIGMAGGPTTSALAAGGGAIARQALSNEPPKPMTAGFLPPEAAPEGSMASRLLDVAEQMGMSRAADLIGPGMQYAGKGLSRMAMNLTPEAAKVAVNEGIAATKAGLAKVMTRIGEVGGQTMAVARKAGAWPGVQARDIATDISASLTPSIEVMPNAVDASKKLGQLNAKFIKSHPDLMNAVQLHQLKQAADQAATPVYTAMQRGELVTPAQKLEAQWNKEVADWARARLTGTADAAGVRIGGMPGGLADQYAELNAKQSGLIKLKNEAWPTVSKGEKGGLASRIAGRTSGYQVGAMTLGGIEGAQHGNSWQQRTTFGVAGSLAGAAVMSPQVLSMLALAAANPTFARLLALGARSGAASTTSPNQ